MSVRALMHLRVGESSEKAYLLLVADPEAERQKIQARLDVNEEITSLEITLGRVTVRRFRLTVP